jgi:purine-nucleoside phosphorylase
MNNHVMGYVNKVKEASEHLEKKLGIKTEIAIILGSGLQNISEIIEEKKVIPYSEIPNFPKSTAPGHKGELIFGKLGNKNVVLMNGRFHYYEGYSMKEVTFPIRVFKELGIEKMIITNAAGGMNPNFERATPCIITDHINFTGDNPLIGQNFDEWGVRFPDMSEPYNKEYIELALKTAKKLGIKIFTGIYLGITGPTFETPAELLMMRNFGADLVGMSTVPEVIVARHCGIKVLGLSAITDMAIAEGLEPVTAEEVIEMAKKTGENISKIIIEVIDYM